MKWIALAVVCAGTLPLAGWLRGNPRALPKIWMLIGFLPFGIPTFHLYMAVDFWAGWPGYVQGIEVSLLDFLALALYLSLPHRTPTVPFRLSMALYFLAVLLSVARAPIPMAAVLYAWQLGRMFLVYSVVAKAADDQRVVPAILQGMAIGVCMEACDAIWERFGLGILQTGGTLGHENFLGLVSHFVTFPCIALLLAGEPGWLPIVGSVAGLLVAALTVSRGTVGLVGAGSIGLFGLSALRGWTPRKARVLAAGLAIAVILSPLVIWSFQQRFSSDPIGSYDERAAFERAASLIISDHPWGIGANSYVLVANVDGYNNRARVAEIIGSDSANVHNIYYLVTAETGYIGLVTFILMLLQPLLVAFRCGWRNRSDRRADLLLGCGMSLLAVYIHSYFEWIFITFTGQYLFALQTGVITGLARQLGYWRPNRESDRMEFAASRQKVIST